MANTTTHTPPDCPTRNRNRSITQAISTSLLSKMSSLALQVISLPMAARVLGKEEFGIFSTISMTLTAVILLQIGVGPALGKQISEAFAANDTKKQRSVYLHGLSLVTSLAILAVSLLWLVTALVPIPTLFGQSYVDWQAEMLSGLHIGTVLVGVMMILSHIDETREGYMEAAITNAWGTIGNLGAAIAVFICIRYHPTIESLLLALFVPQLVARLINLCLLWKKRSHLNPFRSVASFSKSTFQHLLKDGLSYSATWTLVWMVEFNVCALIVGRIYGPSEVGVQRALITISLAFIGLIKMIGTPTWAALIDAKRNGDRDWMAATVKRIYTFYFVLTLTAIIGLSTLGPWLLTKWFGPDFTATRVTFIALGAYLAASGWRQIHHSLSIGVDALRQTIRPILSGLALGMTIGILGLVHFGLHGLFMGLALGTMTMTAWSLPNLVWAKVKE